MEIGNIQIGYFLPTFAILKGHIYKKQTVIGGSYCLFMPHL